MLGLGRIRRILKQNELLRGEIAKKIRENMVLKSRIRRLEMAVDVLSGKIPPDNWQNIEIHGSEMYQRCLHGSEYTQKWCKEQVKKEISQSIIEEIAPHIEYSTQFVDEKHSMMTGRVVISVKEVV